EGLLFIAVAEGLEDDRKTFAAAAPDEIAVTVGLSEIFRYAMVAMRHFKHLPCKNPIQLVDEVLMLFGGNRRPAFNMLDQKGRAARHVRAGGARALRPCGRGRWLGRLRGRGVYGPVRGAMGRDRPPAPPAWRRIAAQCSSLAHLRDGEGPRCTTVCVLKAMLR